MYFLINIFLNYKYLNIKSYYKYFKFIEEIAGYLIKYHVLKSQAMNTWRKEFLSVKK